ncbi:HAMP domain-containing sensor histidine kinase [Candidatus Kapabacteria bacterium]|nr:HAMP domain-containing sensor histidine kinase [Candidatus Kapabacteria bacterium]
MKLSSIVLIILLFTSITCYSKFELKLESTININGELIIPSADSTSFYIILKDEFDQSLKIDKYNLRDTKSYQTKYLENTILINIDANHNSPEYLIYKNNKLLITNPIENTFLELGNSDNILNNNKFKYFKNHKLILLGNKLLVQKNGSLKEFENNIIDAVEYNNSIWYLSEGQNNIFLQNNDTRNLKLRFNYSENSYLLAGKKYLLVVNEFEESIFINIVDSNLHIIKTNWFDKNTSDISFKDMVMIPTKDGVEIIDSDLIQSKMLDGEMIKSVDVNKGFKIIQTEKLLYINDGNSNYKLSDNLKSNDFNFINNNLLVQKDNQLYIYSIERIKYWWFNYIFVENLTFIAWSLFVIVIIILLKKIREKNVMLNNVFDLPTTGIIIHLSKNGNVLNVNQEGKVLLDLPESVPLGKFYQKYFRKKGLEELKFLVEKSMSVKQDFNQKINLNLNKNGFEYLCKVNILKDITGSFNGLIINAVDITEELERKRLSNWAQLAHDMQTNLSIIKLNVEQIDSQDNYLNEKRLKKILHQTNLLITRVRDIITVGRSSKIDRGEFSINSIFEELVYEFDINETIDVQVKSDNFFIKCDKGKLLRALRNAFENAIKAINNENGKIFLSAYRDNRFSYISIKDNGKGMDDKTKESMLDPYFTQDSKSGTGIGTMIMKNVIEQHGGEIEINTILGSGTEIIFKIPNPSR